MRTSTVISTHGASKQLRENTIHSLWEVTNFFASHTAVVMKTGDNNTHDIIKTLTKLREQVEEAQMLDELEE
jgi:hypothetical protein